MHRSHNTHSSSTKHILTSGPLGPGIPACPVGPCCNQKKCIYIKQSNLKINSNKIQ